MPIQRCRSMHFVLSTVACALATMGFISSCSFLLATRIFPSLRLKLPLRLELKAPIHAAKPRPSKPRLKTCLTEQRCSFRNRTRRDSSHSSPPSPVSLERHHPSLRRSASSPGPQSTEKRKPTKLRLRPLSDPISVKFISAAKRTMSHSPKLSVFPMKRECTSAHARARSTDQAEVDGEGESLGKDEGDLPKRFKAVRRQTVGFETHLKKTTDSIARFQRRASRTLSTNDGWDKSTLLRPFVDRRNTRTGFS